MGTALLAMEQGPILHQQQLPIHDYSLSSDHDHYDQFSSHASAHHHHPSYTNPGAVDLRRDAPAVQTPAPFTFASGNGANGVRYGSDRGVAPESSSYQASNNFTDSSGGSISTSPSSAASSLYTNYPHNHCTSVSGYHAQVQLPQAFVPALPTPYASTRIPTLDSTGSGMLPPPNPIRSPISSSTNATDREAYANSTPFVARSQLSPGSQAGYGSYSETPRNAISQSLTGLSLSNPSGHYASAHGHMASSPGYGQTSDCGNFPWPTLEVHAEITCNDSPVTPEVHAKVEKGFFRSTVDQKWTCYRRNYFSVQCNFELHPNCTNGRMMLKRGNSNTHEAIQAMGMRLAAAVDGSAGKAVELVQHTPKRDAGPKNKIEVIKVSPTPATGRGDHNISSGNMYQVPLSTYHPTGQVPGPILPLQNAQEPNSSNSSSQAAQVTSGYPYSAAATHLPVPGANTTHSFERVQFKQATANNGKRRASQQYFHLIVELFADVRKDGTDTPQWVKVAHRVSEKIVVRGRSPSHYQNEGQHQNGRAGSSGGGGSYSTGGASYGAMSTGGFRTSSSGYIGSLGHGTYRSNAYGFQPSPEHSGSSSSSVDGGAQDSDYPGDAVMSDAERNDFQAHDGYRYHPAPIYEGLSHGVGLPLPKIESTARYSTDPSIWGIKSEGNEVLAGAQWPPGGMSRFQGVETSRGYFPDIPSNYS